MERRARNPCPEQGRDVMDHNVQLAVVAHIEQSAGPAFVAAQGVVSFEIEEHSGPNPSNPDELLIRRALVDA